MNVAHVISYLDSFDDLSVTTMVLNLVDPLVDAGDVAEVVQSTVQSLEGSRVADFDCDVMYDFRAQRPIVAYENGTLVDLAQPCMGIDVLTDMHGEHFLYVWGQEPDFRWNAVTADLLDVIERFGVTDVYSFAGMPAGVPHTRPADMLIRTTTRSDIQSVQGTAEHFAQLQDFFEFEAGKRGISVTNIRVRVPFYMAKGPHPFVAGALALLKMMAELGGPTLPLGDLEQLDDQQSAMLGEMVQPESDFAQVLEHLEEDYDKLPSNAGVVRPVDELPQMPSSEEISKAAEQFLTTLTKGVDSSAQGFEDSVNSTASALGVETSGVGAGSVDARGTDKKSIDKNKDGTERDYEAEPSPTRRTSFVERLRRGKHHKD